MKEVRSARCLKRPRGYDFDEPQNLKKCKYTFMPFRLAAESRVDETPELTQTAGRDDVSSGPLALAERFFAELPSFNNIAF